jgi:hypothetical protein
MISTADLSTPRVSISRRGFDEIGGPWVALPHMHSMNLLILRTVQFGAVKQASTPYVVSTGRDEKVRPRGLL